MRGTVPITLVAPDPNAAPVIDEYGQRTQPTLEIRRVAIRRDATGGISSDGSVVLETWDREYSVRKSGMTPQPGWLLRDGGLVFVVESVTQRRHRDRRWALRVRARA